MIYTKSAKETQSFGQKFAKKLKGSEIVLLSGELGAGKTVFVKGMAKGLGIKEEITSPSFLILKDYGKLIHVDLYRLKKPKDLESIGLSEYFGNKDKTIVIEWAEKIKPYLKRFKKPQVWVKIGYKGENKRMLKLKW